MFKFNSLLACSFILATGIAFADTNWTNLQGNAAHTGYIPVKTNPANIKKLWEQTYHLDVPDDKRLPVGDFYSYEGMVIAGETAYLTMYEEFYVAKGSNEGYPSAAIFAIDTNSGKIKWQKMLGDYYEVLPPLYDNGRVFVLVMNRGSDAYQLIAFLADSGKEDYRVEMTDLNWVFGAVTANGNIYNSWNNLVNIDGKTGKLNWLKPKSENLKNALSIPAASDKYIIQNGLNQIEISDAKTGEPLYQIVAEHGYTDQAIPKFPVYDAVRNTVYQGFRTDYPENGWTGIFAFDLDKRKIKWVAISAISQPVLAGDEIYAIGSNHETTPGVNPLAIQARDAATGEIKWQWHFNDIDNWISYSHRYLVATDDVIFVPFDNATIALSRQTHEKVWTTPETGLLVVGDNKLFIVGYEKGKGIKVAGFALS